MTNLVLKNLESNKENFAHILYQEIGVERDEANSIADQVEKGERFIIRNIPPERAEVIAKLLSNDGIYIEEINDVSPSYALVKNFKFTERVQKLYQPVFPSNVISRLGREDTMCVLKEVEQIITDEENYNKEIVELTKELNAARSKEKAIRKHVSGVARLISWIGIIFGAFIGTDILPVIMTIIMAIVAAIIMNLTVKKYDLKIHKEKNDAEADKYALKYIYPLELRMDELILLRNEIIYGGKYDWALNVVGKEMLYSGCIKDLYNLLQSRRADNLKEALNKYDDELYKARMEELQKATQAAAEISALEAMKQTDKMKKIETNTRDAAQTARVNAVLNYGTYENTRQINNKLRR